MALKKFTFANVANKVMKQTPINYFFHINKRDMIHGFLFCFPPFLFKVEQSLATKGTNHSKCCSSWLCFATFSMSLCFRVEWHSVLDFNLSVCFFFVLVFLSRDDFEQIQGKLIRLYVLI